MRTMSPAQRKLRCAYAHFLAVRGQLEGDDPASEGQSLEAATGTEREQSNDKRPRWAVGSARLPACWWLATGETDDPVQDEEDH
jgi:hypothetical protein